MKDLTPVITEISYVLDHKEKYILPNYMNVNFNSKEERFDKFTYGIRMDIGVKLGYSIIVPEVYDGSVDLYQMELEKTKRILKDKVYGNLYSELLDLYQEMKMAFPRSERFDRKMKEILDQLR